MVLKYLQTWIMEEKYDTKIEFRLVFIYLFTYYKVFPRWTSSDGNSEKSNR